MQTYASAIASTPVVSVQTATVVAPSASLRAVPRQRTVYPGNRHRQAKLQLADTLLGRVNGPAVNTLDSSERDVGASNPTEQTNSLQRVVSRSLASPGRPLDPKVQHVMEQRFDYDFSKVRLHDDRRAAAMARLLGATAFTVGWDIGLQQSVQLETLSGRRTLAHELAHVRQSRGQKPSQSRSAVVKGQAEEEATLAARQVTQGLIVRSPLSHTLGIFCERDPRLGAILQELPFRISLYRRGFPGESADQLAEFVIRYLGNAHINLQDRDNRLPVLDVVRAQVGDQVADRLLDRLENAARSALAIGQLQQQEAIRGMMAVRRTPGLVLPILIRPLVNVTAGVPAFFAGIAEGYSSLGSADAQRFIQLVPTFILNMPIVFAGVTFGMDRAIITQAIDLARLVTSLEQMRAAANGILQLLMSSEAEDIAREMGRQIGAEHAAEIREMLNSRGVRAAFSFGRLLGPILLTIYLTALSVGATLRGLSGARMAGELARIERPSRLAQLVQRLYQRYPRFERRVNYALNRLAAFGRRVEVVVGRRIPFFTSARMLRYLRRLRSHSLIQAVRQTYAELRRIPHSDPNYTVRAMQEVERLQQQFAGRTGMQIRTLQEADVVDVSSGAVTQQRVRGIQIRRIEEADPATPQGRRQVPAVLVQPSLAQNPVQHFFELAHDIATYVTQAGGGENPVLAEAAMIIQRRYGTRGITFLEATHAGRLLEISMVYDVSLQRTVTSVAQRPVEIAMDFFRLAGENGEFSTLGRFPATPPAFP